MQMWAKVSSPWCQLLKFQRVASDEKVVITQHHNNHPSFTLQQGGALRVSLSLLPSMTRHNVVTPHPVTQENYRVGAGIVFSFGGESRSARNGRTAEVTRSRTPAAGTPVARLGIIVTAMSDSSGSKIVDVAPGSVAAKASLAIGDVINSVDGKPTHSPIELGTQLTNRGSGEQIHIGYLSHGYWQTEVIIILP